MQQLQYTILQNCSGKQYQKLVETYGKPAVDQLLNSNLIVKLSNGVITRTEEGLQMSRPLDIRENLYKDQKGFNLLTDSEDPKFNDDNFLNS